MIKREYFAERKDGVNLYKSFSDSGLMIRKVGTEEVYEEAIDVEGSEFSYEETEEKIKDQSDVTCMS